MNHDDTDTAITSTEEQVERRQRPNTDALPLVNGANRSTNKINGNNLVSNHSDKGILPTEPSTPISSSEDKSQSLLRGGIPWYMEPFDPVGTTLQEERWTGRELVRGMSEELSDMDEEELSGLVSAEGADGPIVSADELAAELAAKAKAKKRRIANAKRRRLYG